jgi:hypothetical protein
MRVGRVVSRFWLRARRDERAWPSAPCDRGATTPPAKTAATLWAAPSCRVLLCRSIVTYFFKYAPHSLRATHANLALRGRRAFFNELLGGILIQLFDNLSNIRCRLNSRRCRTLIMSRPVAIQPDPLNS